MAWLSICPPTLLSFVVPTKDCQVGADSLAVCLHVYASLGNMYATLGGRFSFVSVK